MFKKFFKKKEEINIDEVFITFRVKKHIEKDFETIGKEYIEGNITDKEFFVDNDEINDYFYDLLKGTEHTFISQYCMANILITYQNREEFLDSRDLCKLFIESGYKNFKDYEFYIVWKDNLNKKQTYLDNLKITERLFLYELHYSLKNNFIY